MSLRSSARTGRDAFWARRGIEEFGGGFLGLLLMKLTEKAEARRARISQDRTCQDKGVLDRILDFFG